MENFISPSVDVADPGSVEWKHFASLSVDALQKRWNEPIGIGMLNSLRGARFSRDAIEKNVDQFAGKFDLRGINLSTENLERLDLSEIDFFASNLTGARCKAAKQQTFLAVIYHTAIYVELLLNRLISLKLCLIT